MSSKSLFPVLALGAVLALLVAGLYVLAFTPRAPAPENSPGDEQAAVPIGGPFTLTDHLGRRVSDSDFRGRFMLIYFGYSFCPDVCPLELARIGRALRLATERGMDPGAVAPLFITVDPERDTVEQLAGHVPLFHPDLVGLTGSPEEIAAVTSAYHIFARKGAASADRPDDYLVDHTSMILLMDKAGEFVAVFTGRESVEDIAARLLAETGAAR